MARWKLCRQTYGKEEFTVLEGEEISIGRGVNNTIVLSSIVISRNHCLIKVQRNNLVITDLKSSNGIYVGLKKIPPNTPTTITEADLIGIGWTKGAPVMEINDHEKFMFRLVRELSISERLLFQGDNKLDEIEAQVAAIEGVAEDKKPQLPILKEKQLTTKRKLELEPVKVKVENEVYERKNTVRNRLLTIDDEIINILSDSDNDSHVKQQSVIKKPKLNDISEEKIVNINPKKEPIKSEQEELEYDAFHVKQEYLGYHEEDPICLDSESDDDGESVQWLMRLSQSSPGKPFIKVRESKSDLPPEESSYSQMDDFLDDDLLNDFITIPPESEENQNQEVNDERDACVMSVSNDKIVQQDEDEDFVEDLISLNHTVANVPTNTYSGQIIGTGTDAVDGSSKNHITIEVQAPSLAEDKNQDKGKKALMIDSTASPGKTYPTSSLSESKHKRSRHSKSKKTSSKRHISNSQKEERKRKLKEIATKDKEHDGDKSSMKDSKEKDTALVSVKSTSSNRGAFLADSVQIVKPMKRKESPQKHKSKEKPVEPSPKTITKADVEPSNDIENERKTEKHRTEHKSKRKDVQEGNKVKTADNRPQTHSEPRVPLKSLKPLSESEESFSGKPVSIVEPFPPKKPKKSVRFSLVPMIHVFEIEEGNKMKSTKFVKASLENNIRSTPFFSLEKVMLMKILRWNPHWLEEQLNTNDPPPILGHNNPPMTIFAAFTHHKQYVQLVGDLLLMEIWECLTQGFMRIRNKPGMRMTIGSLPPVPTVDRAYELFNMTVDVSVPSSEVRNVPRLGEILLMNFGPDNQNRRFFFVHNVRCLPSPKNNKFSYFSISLHTCYTDKMKTLKPGEVMVAYSLAFIQKELQLFEAMEYLRSSPLSEAILKPEPRHFVKTEPTPQHIGRAQLNQWTKKLNPSQFSAVLSSVTAALSERPCIQMVQGPPGTGKSSVICAMVMMYFYDEHERRLPNRGKVLICATSNAAVDELVCRLLNIRQDLPKTGRFRMVRVGRAEAMHPRAHNISSQELARRDAAARQHQDPTIMHAGISEEISHVEAKLNMWQTQERDARDPQRAAYCRSRITALTSRLALLRNGEGAGASGAELRPDQLVQIERRIIEGADIIVTTLASACSHKMRGLKRRIALCIVDEVGQAIEPDTLIPLTLDVLKRRIALCIVDEAGQAIEPETLIPLTLDVTHLTLIGDPQQLPGFICSQRAKKHGLGESLFSRLTSSAETWTEGNPVILLNRQYRMHAEIAEYPNRAFYGGLVTSFAAPRPALPLPPYCILSITSGDKGQGSSGANEMEAWGVCRLVRALGALLRPKGLSLAVITPYNAHKDLIKRNLKIIDETSDVEVNTVDSFQGQERDVVVVSLARSSGVGFLTDAGRMNVMLTRARHALLVCLNPHATIKNDLWRTLVEDAQRRNLFRPLPNKMCQAPKGDAENDDILKYITYTKNV